MAKKTIESPPPTEIDIDELIREATTPPPPEDSVSFDPVAEARAIAAQRRPEVSPEETALNSSVSAVPLGNLTTNALSALVLRMARPRLGATIPEAAQAEMRAEGLDFATDPSLTDEYRAVRDERRERGDAGAAQNPTAHKLGTGLGVGLSILAPLPGVRVTPRAAGRGAGALARVLATPAGARVASSVATGAAYGALGGATDGDADLTRGDVLGALGDTARGAGIGAAWGTAGGVAAEGARRFLPALLRQWSIRNTKEAGQGQSDIGAATRKPMRDESAAQILDDGHLRAFDNVQQIHDRVIPRANAEGERLGAIIRDLEDRGFTGPNARELAAELMAKGSALRNRISSDKKPARVYEDEAASLRDVTPIYEREAAALLGGGPHAPQTFGLTVEAQLANLAARERLGVQQAENIKSSIQGRAPFASLKSTEKGDALKDTARIVRQANERALREQAAARDFDARAAEREVRARATKPDDVAAVNGNFYGDLVQGFIDQKGRTGRYLDFAQFAKRGQSKFDQRPRVGLADTISAAAAANGNPLKEKIWAKIHSEVRSRGASTKAVAQDALRTSLLSGRAGERLGVGVAGLGPVVADEAERWADEQDLDDKKFTRAERALIRALRSRNED